MLKLVTKTKDSVLITAPVLVPGEKDCDYCRGEKPLTRETVEKMAHEYLANYRFVDQSHKFFQQQGKTVGIPVESYITQSPIKLKFLDGSVKTYPKGTWIATTKITDPESVEKALNGEFKGYSVTALSKHDADAYIDKMSGKSRTLINDLEDPVGFTISLVENPCVPGARFCSVKNKEEGIMSNYEEEIESATKSFTDSLKGIFKRADKEDAEPEQGGTMDEEYVKKSDFEAFKNEIMESNKSVLEAIKANQKEEKPDETDEEPEEENKGLTPEEEKQLAALLKKKNAKKEASEEDPASKAAPVHTPQKPAVKSASSIVYEAMGRNRGTGLMKRDHQK